MVVHLSLKVILFLFLNSDKNSINFKLEAKL